MSLGEVQKKFKDTNWGPETNFIYGLLLSWQTLWTGVKSRGNQVKTTRKLCLWRQNINKMRVSKMLTSPVDGDGWGVHADGHRSLFLLEKLSRVPRSLGDDGLRLLGKVKATTSSPVSTFYFSFPSLFSTASKTKPLGNVSLGPNKADQASAFLPSHFVEIQEL